MNPSVGAGFRPSQGGREGAAPIRRHLCVSCAQDHLESVDMSSECKEEVTKDTNRMAHDYRLNWRLNHACEVSIRTRRGCPGDVNSAMWPAGVCLAPLQMTNGSGCEHAHTYTHTHTHLQDDIDTLCAGVCNTAAGQPCGGLVLQCLQDKQDNITSPQCQEEVSCPTWIWAFSFSWAV